MLSAMQSENSLKKVLYTFTMEYKKKWLYRGANTPIMNTFLMRKSKSILGGRLRGLLSGGAPLNPRTQEFFRLTLCCPVLQGYGLTETCSAGTLSCYEDLSSGHVGAPLASTLIKLIDWEEGEYMVSDVPAPRGEVLIGGPTVALGYYNDTERTEEDFQQRGYVRWFATGDIARLRPDGTLVIIDRKSDMVKLQTGEYVSLGNCCISYLVVKQTKEIIFTEQ